MLQLSAEDQEKLTGEHGPGVQMAMSILVRMAKVMNAERLLDIEAAHIDSALFMGDATLEYAEKLAGLGAEVVVPTSLNVSGVDEHGWREWATPPEWAEKARRQMLAYQKMGCTPTWTCAPYQTEFRPAFGQQIAWGESNAIVFANSVLGARTERYPDLLDICAAVTGRAPAVGLHLKENRVGEILFRLQNIPEKILDDDTFYPVFGHLVGKFAPDSVPVIEGLNVKPSDDQLKAFGAATACSGAVALFHIVGVTPEAPDSATAFQDKAPRQTIVVTMKMLREARDELTTGTDGALDMVVLGSPHFSFAEFQQLIPKIKNAKRHENVRFLVTTSRIMRELAGKAGFLTELEKFGGEVTVDTCILTTPMLPPEIKTIMTNSAKYAYYTPGLLNAQVVFGSLEDCVESAVKGRIIRDDSFWSE